MDDETNWGRAGDELLPTRKTLLSRLRNWDDQESWNEFFTTYWKLIYSTARKAGLSDAEAQDAVQETVVSVCKNMPGFRYDPKVGSFKSWLLQLTRWRIQDQVRKRFPGKVHASDEDRMPRPAVLESIPDPAGLNLAALWDEEWNKSLLEAAVERVKHRVDPKQFQLFDLYVLQKWPVQKIGSLLKVNRGRVYLAKHRISSLIKTEVRHLEERVY